MNIAWAPRAVSGDPNRDGGRVREALAHQRLVGEGSVQHDLGFGRIVVSENEVPNMLAILV